MISIINECKVYMGFIDAFRYRPYIIIIIGVNSAVSNFLINPLRAKFFRENINIYLHFMSLLHIDKTQVLKILPQVRPGPTYST